MGFNKVTYQGYTLIDISDSTVTPENLGKDVVAYDANGDKIIGVGATGEAVEVPVVYHVSDLFELPTEAVEESLALVDRVDEEGYDLYAFRNGQWERDGMDRVYIAKNLSELPSDAGNGSLALVYDAYLEKYCVYVKDENGWKKDARVNSTREDLLIPAYRADTAEGLPSDAEEGAVGIVIGEGAGWKEVTWEGLSMFLGSQVWSDGENTYWMFEDLSYRLRGNTWEEVSFSGLPDMSGNSYRIINLSNATYMFVNWSTTAYRLNGLTWEPIGLSEGCDVNSIFTYNNNIYRVGYEKTYVFVGNGWEEICTNPNYHIVPGTTWKANGEVYSTQAGEESGAYFQSCYKFVGDGWQLITINNFANIVPNQVWNDNNGNAYFDLVGMDSRRFLGNTWTLHNWPGVAPNSGQNIWHHNGEVYLSEYSNHYKLDIIPVEQVYYRRNGAWEYKCDL